MYKCSEFTKRIYKTGEVAKILQLHYQTVIQYDRLGKLKFHRNESDRRVMFREDLLDYLREQELLIDDEKEEKRDVIYCRVSSQEQQAKGDLDRQVVKVLECAENFHLQNPLVLKEVGSGLDENRKEIQRLIAMVLHGEVSRIFVTYKDCLTRFGYHYLECICQECGVKIHAVCEDKIVEKNAQEELVADMMEVFAKFTGEIQGMQSETKKEFQKQIEEIPILPKRKR